MPAKRQNAGSSTNQKRTRFASPPPGETEVNDDLLEEDLPENAAKEKSRSKRMLKDQSGYGSDSSNDEESVVTSRRPKAKGEDEDDDMDMFADDIEEKTKEKIKPKDKEFMDLNEIEGQEFERDADEGYNSDDEKQRRREGLDGDMGIEITPFNMKAEMDEGKFTADGETYVTNDKDPNEKHDVWLAGMDEAAIQRAREAHAERERQEKEREDQEEKDLESSKQKQEDLMRAAVGVMERGETVLEALQRLGKEVEDKRRKEEGGKKKSWAEKQRERKAAAAVELEQA
jgi:CD2 antigen cytoplasmic tail-binding protein 2